MIKVEETIEKYGHNPEAVGKTSTKPCIARCDYCFVVYEKTVREVMRSRKKVVKDACRNRACILKKYKEVYSESTVKKIDKINEKREMTCLDRFGVTNAAKSDEKKAKYKKTVLERYGVDHFSKTEEFAGKVKISFEEIIQRAQRKGYIQLFEKSEYENNRKPHLFKCIKHKREFETSVFNLSFGHLQCPMCSANSSFQEREIFEYVRGLVSNVTERDRKSIPPYELDIHVPPANLAIEFHGLYWHSEKNKSKDLHYKKFLLCKERGTSLFQIFEDEWRDKRSICESMIRVRLGKARKVHARKLKIKTNIKKEIVEAFFQENHLAGNVRFSKSFCLVDENENIVSAISFRTPFTKNKERQIEIARLSSLKNVVVVGGFSKLMKYAMNWAKESGHNKILTYSDCRYSQGNVYKGYGFDFIGHTKVGYDYTNFKSRFNRFKFRARDGFTEREVAAENDVYRIYNAGNFRWELNL